MALRGGGGSAWINPFDLSRNKTPERRATNISSAEDRLLPWFRHAAGELLQVNVVHQGVALADPFFSSQLRSNYQTKHTERCRLPSQMIPFAPKPSEIMADSGANSGVFCDPKFFDPGTLRPCWAFISGVHGTSLATPLVGTVHFVLQGDRGDEISVTLENQLFSPNCPVNILGTSQLHDYGLTSVFSPSKTHSGLWYDFDKPTARKFATFTHHNRLLYLRPRAIGVSAIAHQQKHCYRLIPEIGASAETAMVEPLAWFSDNDVWACSI